MIAAAGRPGNFFFKTSIRPTLLRSEPWIAALKAGISSGEMVFLGFVSLLAGLAVCCDEIYEVRVGGLRMDGDFTKSVVEDDLGVKRLLMLADVDFIVLRGIRGGSMEVLVDGGGSQYAVEKGSMDLIDGSEKLVEPSQRCKDQHTKNDFHSIRNHLDIRISSLPILPAKSSGHWLQITL